MAEKEPTIPDAPTEVFAAPSNPSDTLIFDTPINSVTAADAAETAPDAHSMNPGATDMYPRTAGLYPGAAGTGYVPPAAPFDGPIPYPVPQQQPPYVYYLPYRPTNGLAVASFVLGIFSFLFSWLFPFLTLVPGIICGHLGLRQIQTSGEDGRVLAIIGLVLNYIPIAIWSILVVTGLFSTTLGIIAS